MTHALISLDGLIHLYKGNKPEYPKKPEHWPSAETNFFEQEKYKSAVKAFESQCFLVEDQERVKAMLVVESFVKISSKALQLLISKIPNRVLYFIESPEMESVEQFKCEEDSDWTDRESWNIGQPPRNPQADYRTIVRFKEGTETKTVWFIESAKDDGGTIMLTQK